MKDSSKPVVIFGVSTLARLAYVYLTEDSPFKVAAFTVHRRYIQDNALFGIDVVPFEELEGRYPPDEYSMFVAIGYKKVNKVRAEIFALCKRKGYDLISYVSSKTIHWNHIEIGENCFIYGAPVIQPFAKIGNDVVIGGASIGHDSHIGDHCYIASHAVVAGHVTVGKYCFVGVNATIRDAVRIAPECIIGAGAVVLKDTREGGVYSGHNAELSAIASRELRSFQ